MMRGLAFRVLAMGMMVISPLTAIAQTTIAGPQEPAPRPPVYYGIETRMLQDDLVEFRVAVAHADVELTTAYADCAAAQYALVRGFGYARQIRTLMDGSARMMRAQAAYLFSRDLPAGEKTIDARQVVDDCRAKEIPTV